MQHDNFRSRRLEPPIDQNLSRRLPALLAADFPGCEHVLLVGMATASDNEVWQYAAQHRLTVVSKDADFVAISRTLGFPPKVIWLRIGNTSTQEVVALLTKRAADIKAFISNSVDSVLMLY